VWVFSGGRGGWFGFMLCVEGWGWGGGYALFAHI